ncbi:MAG: ferrochelatase, partial [Actinomycetaceae bacterium]|nr:ferrochelatase [Actinomycetaceae bacterium]
IMRQAREYCAQSGAPKLTIVDPWYDLDSYIAWHATRIKEELATGSYDKIIMSYHGVPERAVHEPASYRAQCERTTHAIMERVGDIPYEMTFQSKFGPGKWLGPATIDRMAELPGEGARNILLLTPGFFADCIETLQEIDSQNQEVFKAAGGVEFRRIAPPNADATAGQMLADIYRDAVA